MRSALLVVACVLGTATFARADVTPEDAAKATALFEQGHTAIEAGRIDEACERFDASLKLDPQLGTRLNLADCRERQSRFIEAYTLFTDASDQATLAGKEGRATFARDRLNQLRARLVRLTLHVAEPAPTGLAIRLTTATGPQDLKPATWAQPQMIEPGSIVVEVSAPDREPRRIARDALGGADVVIDVPALAPAAVVRTAPPILAGERSRSTMPYIVGGAGGGLLVGSLLLGLHGQTIYNDALAHGGPGIDHEITRAEHWADVGTGFAIAGALAVSAGVYLFIRDRHDPIVVAPAADMHGASLFVGGRL